MCVYLLLGGQFSYAVRFVESKVDHGLKQRNGLLRVPRLTQEMTLLGEDIWTERKQLSISTEHTNKNLLY